MTTVFQGKHKGDSEWSNIETDNPIHEFNAAIKRYRSAYLKVEDRDDYFSVRDRGEMLMEYRLTQVSSEHPVASAV